MPKLRVGLLFGGRSVEHEVSIASATSILEALDPNRYDVQLIAVDHAGSWRLGQPALPPEAAVKGLEVALAPCPSEATLQPRGGSLPAGAPSSPLVLDVIFPIIHGRGGEDGCLQGLLELAEIAYVGAGVLGSSIQMDKDIAKRLLAAAGLPVVPWVVIRNPGTADECRIAAERAASELGLPAFVKPVNSGSSVGIAKAHDVDELAAAILDAARYDTKVMVERAVDAREIEVAVIGGRPPEASVPGEIVSPAEFYDYESKYVDERTELVIPADLPKALAERIRGLAVQAFEALEGEGLARVDFFVERSTSEVSINELNSLPGFTESSMFPRLWEASGLGYPALLDRLIELALERRHQRSKLETTYRSGSAGGNES